ncbi:MAG: D-alanine--D-alanine ligase [Rhodospirillales bacterium]|jgi:D-alanine-D-alanine ligase|nr:D-alanine--D-alanine ligase [Rhodospirillales bacterium]
MTRHVAVLMGGWSAEREVSLVSGAAVSRALEAEGFHVSAIDVGPDVGILLSRLHPRPDVIFNALHGRYGEDGCIQGILNVLGIPYTHSGMLASAVAMDKPLAKTIFAAAGVPVAEHVVVSREEAMAADVMERPYVVKPTNQGSSVGVHIVRGGDNRSPLTGDERALGSHVMVERYIDGKELTVAIMGNRPLAVTEITSDHEFYDYEAKYAEGGSAHLLPAPLDAEVYDEVMRLALSAHGALGCRGVSRADMRYDGESIYMLEVNTQPGMTPTSLVPEQAAHVDISFNEIVTWMVENAECDQ